ncbi:MAG: 1-acyl-sn-glycerol-3-phosphate acyltransferase [Saprospiraceae bacterium]|nr:1-acyl-sn-glycerol-3-phosphate acyltransferase [Saprospiraceae bacterium]
MLSIAGLYLFYRRRIILGLRPLNFKGPAIIVVNHPSTLMDVLNPCIHIPRESFFLANYSMFKNPVMNWLLTRLFCIPVKRREDVADGELRNNDTAFEKSIQHLEQGGMLFVAAEGVSWMDRTIRPFKSGAARIAFGAEQRNLWELGVNIFPVGLSYNAPNLFRSEVIVHFGQPISATAWQEAVKADSDQAIDLFTEQLRQQIENLTLNTHSIEKQPFIERVELFFQHLFPHAGKALFDFRKSLIENNISNQNLEKEITSYFEQLEKEGLGHEAVREAFNNQHNQWRRFLILIFGAPFALAGYLFWFLPCYLPWLLAKKLNLYIGYDSNVKFLTGLFTFPLALWGAFKAVVWATGNSWWGWAALPGLFAVGYFSEFYGETWKAFRQTRHVSMVKRSQPEVLEAIKSAYLSILSLCIYPLTEPHQT